MVALGSIIQILAGAMSLLQRLIPSLDFKAGQAVANNQAMAANLQAIKDRDEAKPLDDKSAADSLRDGQF